MEFPEVLRRINFFDDLTVNFESDKKIIIFDETDKIERHYNNMSKVEKSEFLNFEYSCFTKEEVLKIKQIVDTHFLNEMFVELKGIYFVKNLSKFKELDNQFDGELSSHNKKIYVTHYGQRVATKTGTVITIHEETIQKHLQNKDYFFLVIETLYHECLHCQNNCLLIQEDEIQKSKDEEIIVIKEARLFVEKLKK